ncbi:MAG: DNA-3-methyladenine glycosylase 2 [Leptospirales bacterium]
MMIDDDACYSALLTHDARFDGRFFVGVSTTRIYCRPICPAKQPKKEHCRFFPSAAAAEQSGFRPCMRCRPEQSPGMAQVDRIMRLSLAAADLIENGFLRDSSMKRLAMRLGVTDRHLRRAFSETFGVPPVRYAQTQRLLLARQLLKDTSLSILDVAMVSGFNSLRRMNEFFRDRYRTNPSRLRRSGSRSLRDEMVFELAFRPPYAWQEILAFLEGRAIQNVESVSGGIYRRSVLVPVGTALHSGWISVEPDLSRNTLKVTISSSLSRVISQVLGRVRRLFDLSCSPSEIGKSLGPLISRTPGLRVPGAFDGFEMAVRAIIGQQVSVKAARTLAGRFSIAFGAAVDTPYPEITRTFPLPGQIARLAPEELSGLGITQTRIRTILSLANACRSGTVSLSPVPDIQKEIRNLRTLPGIGEWTAQYIAMRVMAWPDAFPHTDLGIMKALNERSPGRVLEIAESWRPWRAYAAMALWQSL